MQCTKCGFRVNAIELYHLDDDTFGDRSRWANDPEHRKTLEFYAWFLAGQSEPRILDLGSGPGTVAVPLCRLEGVREVVCFDVDVAARGSLDKAKGKYLLAGLTIVGDQGQPHCLPFASGFFDAIVCRYSMHHFPDQQGAMREMWRCLKKRGFLFYSDPAMPPHSRTTTEPLYRKRETTFNGYRTYHEMVDSVVSQGFEILAIRPYDYQRGTFDEFLKEQAVPLKAELIRDWMALDAMTKAELKWPGLREGPFITYPIIDIAALKPEGDS